MAFKIIYKNRKASFDYQRIEEFTAGVMLEGHEVKSIRNGNIDLKGAFVVIRDGDAWLTNAHIKQYEFAKDLKDYDATRPRKLLLRQKELDSLYKAKESKLSIIPLDVRLSGSFIKIQIAIARGKKHKDKRKTIQKRDVDRDIARSLKR